MNMVLPVALGVGGATVIGAGIGFAFRRVSHQFSDIVLAFAAGVMLAAAVLGLILPSLSYGGRWGIFYTILGIFVGAVFLNVVDAFVPHLHRLAGTEYHTPEMNRVLLFVAAIAIHNFPEGIAAGVGFGLGNTAEAFLIAGGIALQNIPEGMVMIGPMLAVGVKPGRTFLCAILTGLIEVCGTFLGYFFVHAFKAILPFTLAFAGGAMLYVISDEMIPETHAHGTQRGATYALLTGFCVMLLSETLLG